MSTTAADDRRTRYNPVVATTDFAADFPVFDNDDLKVFVDGVERDDFAVTATYVNGIANDAKAVFAVGVTGVVDVVGYRDPHRTNRFVDGAPLPPRDINLALDTLEGEAQEARRDISQAAKSPYGSAAYEFDPNLADGQSLVKSGSKLVPGPTASQIASAAGYAAAAAAAQVGAEAALNAVTGIAASKMDRAANLSDVADIPTSRANLGLGSMAVQDANNVAITGGTAAFTGALSTTGTLIASNGTDGAISLTGGAIEIGKAGRASAGAVYIDFHSSAGSPDYDVRIMSTNGSTTAGNGSLVLMAANFQFKSANPIIYVDKAASGGLASINGRTNGINRWSLELGSAEAETGSNAGSNASLSRFSDAGSWLGFALQISRATGDITLGSGLVFTTFGGYAAIQPTDRLILRDNTPALTDVYNVGVLRNASGLTGGTAGFVNSALRVETTVDAVSSYEWALLSTITVNGAGGGEHVAGYLQAVKNANNTVWSACTELRDWVANPTTGSVGIEVGIFVSGTDANEMRHGIDISIGSANNGTGTNVVSSGIRIGPSLGESARAQFTNGVQISGKGICGLNLLDMDISYADRLIRLPNDAYISWRNQGTNVESAAIAWNAAIATWQRSGLLLTTAAPTGGTAGALPAQPVGYINEQINGTMRKIPYYH